MVKTIKKTAKYLALFGLAHFLAQGCTVHRAMLLFLLWWKWFKNDPLLVSCRHNTNIEPINHSKITVVCDCHEYSLCGALHSPPEVSISGVLIPLDCKSHNPRTCGWFVSQVFPIHSLYLNCSLSLIIAKSCLAMHTFLSVYSVCDFPCMTWTVYWTLNLCCLPVLIASALLFDYPVCLPPALILSLNSDFDSALSTLLLKPVIDPCLFDVNSVLIKLHMDSQDNASPLQVPFFNE